MQAVQQGLLEISQLSPPRPVLAPVPAPLEFPVPKQIIEPQIVPLQQNNSTRPSSAPPDVMNHARYGGDSDVASQDYIEISDDEEDAYDSALDYDEEEVEEHPSANLPNILPRQALLPLPNGNSPPGTNLGLASAGNSVDPAMAEANHGFMYNDELDVQDPEIARFLMEDFRAQVAGQDFLADQQSGFNEQTRLDLQATCLEETEAQCVDNVVALFPDICRSHVSQLFLTIAQKSNQLIAHILDKMEKGTQYPKAKDSQRTLKRKRDVDEEEELDRKYGAADRVTPNISHATNTFM